VEAIVNRRIHAIGLSFAMFSSAVMPAQEPTHGAVPSQKQANSPREFGQSYAALRPEQKKLLEDYIRRYNATAGSKATPEEAYDDARMSVRTTFDAVTHALLTTKLTDEKGQSLGRAIDLIDALDDVMGEEAGTRATNSSAYMFI
jgi:hypothetical protein